MLRSVPTRVIELSDGGALRVPENDCPAFGLPMCIASLAVKQSLGIFSQLLRFRMKYSAVQTRC